MFKDFLAAGLLWAAILLLRYEPEAVWQVWACILGLGDFGDRSHWWECP